MTNFHLFATTPKGLELLLVDELRQLGANDAAEKLAGVTFTGDLELAYKACLWSRLANRILLRLAQFPASTPEELYAGVQSIAWDQHLNSNNTINVNFVTSHSVISHTLFGAQKVKDAIVDQFREKYNERPSVARDNADVSVHVYLSKNIATISIDLSGESLHKRGYRLEQGAAPLKENLAAAILMRAGWKKIADQKGMLLDPMCGSGTLLIEGAFIAADIAPGLLRDYFGFLGWKKHDAILWKKIVEEAKQRQNINLLPTIIGYDADSHAIKVAFANIERAGLHGKIHVEKKDILACVPPKNSSGLFVTNPPYGERLGEMPELNKLYENIGAQLKKEFAGWKAAVFTGNPELGKTMGLRAIKHYALFNGAIPCQLLLFDVQSDYFVDRSPEANNERRIRRAIKLLTDADRTAAKMFLNRIQKNIKNLKSLVQRENLSHYRIYDADIPEYAVSVDIYQDVVCVKEYHAPKSVDKQKAEQRLNQLVSVLPEALNQPAAKIFVLSNHFPNEGNDLSTLYSVEENHTNYLINLIYTNLEVGLPPEQRNVRTHIKEIAKDKQFLHLFSRSGAMTVCAGLGGAKSIKSVAENELYAEWTRLNLEKNGLAGQVVTTDIPQWVQKERFRYDLIFAELPDRTFHLSQAHPNFVYQLTRLLNPEGELFLITRDPRFKLPKELVEEFQVEDIGKHFLASDFQKNPKIYQCIKIRSP